MADKMTIHVKTSFLFALPSFLSGFARAYDPFGDFAAYNFSQSSKKADAEAIYNDWKMLADDIKEEFLHLKSHSHVQKSF